MEENPSDLDWQDIVDILGLNCHRDSLRKATSVTTYSAYNVMKYLKEKACSDDKDYLRELEQARINIEIERVKLHDERVELNREIRNLARLDDRMDRLEVALLEKGKEEYEISPQVINTSDNDLIIILSDLHLGADFDSFTGRYNSTIAKERLQAYLSKILQIKNIHSSENAYVTIIGDLINGNIHNAVAVKNRENVVEQLKVVSALITNFLNELTKKFTNVYVNSVSGNHSRIQRKEDALKDERLDDIPIWYSEGCLSHKDNIHFLTSQPDNTLAYMYVRGKSYVSVHGDNDNFSDTGVMKLTHLLGFSPYCVIFGHKHYSAMNESGGVKMVQSGSLCGSGDDYTIERRLFSKPSQTVLVCTEAGIEACYPIEFENKGEKVE